MTKYAGVGSRQTPADIQSRMMANASHYAYKGYELVTGGCHGPDKAYEKGAILQNGRVTVFTSSSYIPMWAKVFTDFFHPAPQRLTPEGKRLMHRNAMIVLGENGDDPVDFVECYTQNAGVVGGTAQAMRIAYYFKIPVYNLGKPDNEQPTLL